MDKEYLDNKQKLGINFNLNRIKAVLKSLGNPEKNFPCVHIAGTNGKGSVSAFITSALVANGIKTGTYNSPSVFSRYEGIRINNQEIKEKEYCILADEIKRHEIELKTELTFFETETVIAFLYFSKNKIDLAVVECGMGGRYDATNAGLNTLVAVLTSIGLEHTEYLGDTVCKIAQNKAEIIPVLGKVVCAPQEDAVLTEVKKVCSLKNAELTVVAPDKLEGALYQRINRAVAMETLDKLKSTGFNLSKSITEEAVVNTVWAGRYQKLSENFILDGAHNPSGMEMLKSSLDKDYGNTPRIFLFGAFKDKNTLKMCQYLVGAKRIYVLKWDNPRASDPEKLLNEVEKFNNNAVVSDIENAVKLALAEEGENIIVATGSLSHLAQIKRAYEESKNG